VLDKREIVEYLKSTVLPAVNNKKLLVITAGAGDIDTIVEPVRRLMSESVR
jgi:hypothetical protein